MNLPAMSDAVLHAMDVVKFDFTGEVVILLCGKPCFSG